MTMLAVTVAAVGLGSAALAAPAGGSGKLAAEWESKVRFTPAGSPGTKNSIAAEYATSRADRQRGRQERAHFAGRAAAELGIYYDAGSLDYLKLERSDRARHKTVEVVVPRDYKVKAVEFSEGRKRNEKGELGTSITASIEGEIPMDSSDVVVPDGPGFDSFVSKGSGSYMLYAGGVGEMLALWYKQKSDETSDGTWDYWSYQRKARASSYDISGPNYGLDYFGIKSYAGSSYPLHHWVDWAPGVGNYEGDCNNTAWNLSLTYGSASTSISFQDCGDINIAINNGSPGDMSANWYHEFAYPDTSRELAFNWIAARGQGLSFYANDFQKVAFWSTFYELGTGECASTNQTVTC